MTEHHPDDNVTEMSSIGVLRRGLAMSPELRDGLGVTILMALSAAVGRLIIPILIQQILDKGVLGSAGYRAGFVWAASVLAMMVIIGVMVTSKTAYFRLVKTAEDVLLGLRVRAFAHIQRLSMSGARIDAAR